MLGEWAVCDISGSTPSRSWFSNAVCASTPSRSWFSNAPEVSTRVSTLHVKTCATKHAPHRLDLLKARSRAKTARSPYPRRGESVGYDDTLISSLLTADSLTASRSMVTAASGGGYGARDRK